MSVVLVLALHSVHVQGPPQLNVATQIIVCAVQVFRHGRWFDPRCELKHRTTQAGVDVGQ